jgi:hypothetical protein
MAVVNTHPDVWIMKDLWTIAIYYPELADELDILDTQTIFVDYESAAKDEIKELLNKASSNSWQLKNAPEGFIENGGTPRSAYAPADQWILKGQEWVKYLQKYNNLKPGNVIYHQDFYNKIVYNKDPSTGISAGGSVTFKTKGWYAGRDVWIRYIKRLNWDGINRHRGKTLADDRVAAEHSPLSYFPTEIDLSKVVFYDPLLGTAELSKFYQWYGPIFGNIIFQYCASHGRKIFYKEIVTFNKYDITIDFSMFGLNNKYTVPFNEKLEKLIDPFEFLGKEVYKEMSGENSNYLVFNGKVESNGTLYYQYDVYDFEMLYFDNTTILRVRDSYIQNFLRGNAIPLNPQDYENGIEYYPEFYERMLYPMHLVPQTNWSGFFEFLKIFVGIAVTCIATLITAGAAMAAVTALVMVASILVTKLLDLITSNATVKMIGTIGIAAATAKILNDNRTTKSSQVAKIDTKKVIKEAVVGSLDMIEEWTRDQNDSSEAIDVIVENLDREESEKLIQILAEIANRRAVAETPHGHGFVMPSTPHTTHTTSPHITSTTGPSLMPLLLGGSLAYLLLKK